ncbi:hypothetical protein K438DRAFT_1633725, partial [Mycena galopus ATCC 62051]
RATVRAYVDAHRALISPIRRLPSVILQEIFVACLSTHWNCVMSSSSFPVLLGRICSLWRTLSLSAPRLWSHLRIDEPFPADSASLSEQQLAKRIEGTKTWLGRSGQCSLSISLWGRSPSGPAPSDCSGTAMILQALIPFAHRWLDISLRVPFSALNSLANIAKEHVPMLKTLHINEIAVEELHEPINWGSSEPIHSPDPISTPSLPVAMGPVGVALHYR